MLQGASHVSRRWLGMPPQTHIKPSAPAFKKRHWSEVSCAAEAPAVLRPPESYSHREQLLEKSLELVSQRHPELTDLVLKGDLYVVERGPAYQERRSDVYQEPEVVFVLGTAHASHRSVEDVRRLVHAVQPDCVVVELCRSRAALMYSPGHQQEQLGDGAAAAAPAAGGGRGGAAAGGGGAAAGGPVSPSTGQAGSSAGEGAEETGVTLQWNAALPAGAGRAAAGVVGRAVPGLLNLSGPGLLPALQRSLELGGRSALLLRLLLSALSSRAGGPGGPATGGELVAARLAAEATGAQIVLGDGPIEITLRRAWQALSWPRRLQLAGQLFEGAWLTRGQVQLDEDAIERLKDDDTLSLIFARLGKEFPEVMDPLIHERDCYLAWSLKRSKAVNGAKRVVGLVGKGHLRGVCYALEYRDGTLRFKDLVGGGRGERGGWAAAGRLLRQAAVEGAALGALWWAWSTWSEQP